MQISLPAQFGWGIGTMRLRFCLAAMILTSPLALQSFSANAADIYMPGPGGYKDAYVPTWAGFYAGVNVGGAFGNVDVKDKDFLNGGAKYSFSPSSAIGGAQMGFNFQRGNFVFGVEGDIGGLPLSGKKFDPNFPGGTYSGLDGGVYGDLTGRLGFAFDRALIYAKGGYVFASTQTFVDNTAGSFGGGRGFGGILEGWTIGGGLEYLLAPAWSVKAEYQHFDFGNDDAILFTPANGNFSYSNHVTVDAVTVGVNYHFGRESISLK
jgi:outer membrane immunogenic protein